MPTSLPTRAASPEGVFKAAQRAHDRRRLPRWAFLAAAAAALDCAWHEGAREVLGRLPLDAAREDDVEALLAAAARLAHAPDPDAEAEAHALVDRANGVAAAVAGLDRLGAGRGFLDGRVRFADYERRHGRIFDYGARLLDASTLAWWAHGLQCAAVAAVHLHDPRYSLGRGEFSSARRACADAANVLWATGEREAAGGWAAADARVASLALAAMRAA